MSQELQNRFMIMKRQNIIDTCSIWNQVAALDHEDMDWDWFNCRDELIGYFKNKPMHYFDWYLMGKLDLPLFWHLRMIVEAIQ